MRFKLIILFITLIFSASFVSAQITRPKIVGGYIYNFGNKVNWTNNDFEKFKIVLLSVDQSLITEFTKMSQTQKIHGKTISLTVLPEPNAIVSEAQLVFIAKDKLAHYMDVFDKIEGKEVLLVSENFKNKSYVMLNLFGTDNGKILFEINKPNILNQKLSFSDEMLMMGGTEIDIAEIYMKSQHSLRDMELKVNSFGSKLERLQEEIELSREKVNEQESIIGSQKSEINKHKETLEEQEAKANDYKKVIALQVVSLENLKSSLLETKSNLEDDQLKLKEQKHEISKSKEEIKESNSILDAQIAKIDSINKEIEHKNTILSDKDDVISFQKKRMNLMVGVIIIIAIFILIIFYAYYQNRKKSRLLLAQKEQINTINEELNANNEELKTTVEELQETQQQLVQSAKMASLGVLSAGIAHEINNPINFVYAGINSLMRDFEDIDPILNEINSIDVDSDKLKEKIEKINKLKEDNYFDEAYEAIPEIITQIKLGADRTAEIVKGLQSFSRSDRGEVQLLYIHEGIETSLLLLQNKYKIHVEIVKNYGSNIPEIKCKAGKINQVILNILSNAIDSINESGKIVITTKETNGNVVISVKDNGSGIDPEIQQRIFDPFFTTKAVGQGTGLGLSISYGIIQEHNGTIELKSEINKGTEFIITLPVK